MNAIQAREMVVLVRHLRDGTVTEERLERWLAELVMGCIAHHEPNVARAKIVPLPVEAYRHRHYPVKRTHHRAYRQALALAKVAFGSDLSNAAAPLVA